ncbi:MAG: SPOR domain-containing protein [Bacteroidales bacterium]|nr:SPOR domain-containing protein [Bacteroidales bacterium]MBN2819038.1 SPOR domain-containing protein [Bacteroidales bacterium]
MDELIIKLLKDNGRVIIPDFGALIVKQKTPFRVIFNEFLQYNDGALVNALIDKMHLDKAAATDKIKQLAEEYTKTLNTKSILKFEGIGSLSRSTTGKISFIHENEEIPEGKEQEPETKQEEEKVSSVEFDLTGEPKTESQPERPDAPIKKEGAKPKPVIQQEETRPEKEIKKESQSALEPLPINEYYEQDPKNRWVHYLVWGTIIIIVNGALIGFFFFGDELRAFFKKDKQEQTESLIPSIPQVEETIENAAITGSKTDSQEIMLEEEPMDELANDNQDEKPSDIVGTKYYVVAGVFQDEANADKLVLELSKKGYNSEKFGKIGSLWAVSFDVFPTKSEADAYMLKIKREVNPETWIRAVN